MTERATLIRVLVAAAIALFFCLLVYSGREALIDVWRDADRGLLIAASCILALSNFGAAIVFSSLLKRDASLEHSHGRLVGVFLFSQIAKYVPGRIWGVAAQSAALRSANVLPRLLEVNLELAGVVAISASGIGMVILLGASIGYPIALAVLAAIFLILLKGLSSGWFPAAIRRVGWTIPFVRERMGSRGDNSQPAEMRISVRLCCGLAIFMGAYILGWWLLVMSLPHPGAESQAEIVAALSLSYVVGMLSLLPAGIGAREGAFVLLAPVLSLPVATLAAIAVSSRAVLVLVDAISAFVGYALIASRGWQRDG